MGFRFAGRLTPKGGRDSLHGRAEGSDAKPYLKARVSSPLENGKANEALVRLLAAALGIGKSNVRIVSGTASRVKMIEVEADLSRFARLGKHP
jgi:uncharacterized protein YggU (UPF0235/DUF167 family)